LQYLYALGIKAKETRNNGRRLPFLRNYTRRMVADPRTPPEQRNGPRVSMCVPKRLRIGLLPYDSGVNLYAERLRANLSELGEVVPVGTPLQRIARVFAKKPSFDLVIAGWLENALLTESGRLSVLGLGKMIAQSLVLRAQARRIVYVRHNRYPHSAKPKHARMLTGLLDNFERLHDLTLTHSPAEAGPARIYCPHPLYDTTHDEPLLPHGVDLDPGYFVVFGRIAPYKNIEALIAGFPDNKRLLVAGVVDDDAYARRLMQLRRPNVVIAPGYLSEAQAQSVLRRAAGVVVCHAPAEVIVTGSFFYAISLNKPVYAVTTAFLHAMQAQVGARVLQTAADIPQLCQMLSTLPSDATPSATEWSKVRAAFSDTAICQHLTAIFTRLGLIQIYDDSTSVDPFADVA
jgi:glycosyltransferase involved in cell wall biosynthesis